MGQRWGLFLRWFECRWQRLLDRDDIVDLFRFGMSVGDSIPRVIVTVGGFAFFCCWWRALAVDCCET